MSPGVSYSRNSAWTATKSICLFYLDRSARQVPKCSFLRDLVISVLCLPSLLTDKRRGCSFQHVWRIHTDFLSKWQVSLDCELCPKILKGLIKTSIILILEIRSKGPVRFLCAIIASISSWISIQGNLSMKSGIPNYIHPSLKMCIIRTHVIPKDIKESLRDTL